MMICVYHANFWGFAWLWHEILQDAVVMHLV